MDMAIGASEFVKATSMMTGASAVALPGVRRVIMTAAEVEALHKEQEAELGRLLRFFSPASEQLAALQKLGVSVWDGFANGVEVLPIRKRPLKPTPRGRDALVKRQKKARL